MEETRIFPFLHTFSWEPSEFVSSNLLHLLNFNLTYICPLLLFSSQCTPNILPPQQSHIIGREKHDLHSNDFKVNDGHPCHRGHWPFPPGRRDVPTVLSAFKNVARCLMPLFLFYYLSPSLGIVTENSKSTVPFAILQE